MSALIDHLRSIVGNSNVLTEAADLRPYCTDWRGRYSGQALCAVRPGSTDEVAAVVTACAAAGVAIVPQGGNTGLVGGATPLGGEVVVSTSRLDRIRNIDIANNTITVDAGCTLAAVQAYASQHDRLFPLSLASEGSCQIGGNLATNAGGVHVLRYGNMRDLTLGIEAVLPDGRVWEGLRALRKDNTGYDLKQLFIGGEGTLGIITAAVLKLFPLPHSRVVTWVSLSSATQAVALLTEMQSALGDCLTAFELVSDAALELVLRHIPDARAPTHNDAPWFGLIELSHTATTGLDERVEAALAAALAAGLADDVVIARSETQCRDLWALRENISEAQRREGVSIKHDISLPTGQIATFLQRAGTQLRSHFTDLRIVAFGHLGDGNLHYNLSKSAALDNATFIADSTKANRIVHDLVASLGGSISAEHGIGQLKRDAIRNYKSTVELHAMRLIKNALDPAGLMNPGKLI